MRCELNEYKVTKLPNVPTPNSRYYLLKENGQVEEYLTDKNGNLRLVGNNMPILHAGTTSVQFDTLYFSNSNNVEFGLSGSTITASVNGAGGGVALSAQGSSISSGTVILSNSNGMTFGMNGSTITASYTVPTDYISSANSSLFLGSGYTSHSHSEYLNTSVSSIFQQTSQMSEYMLLSNSSQFLDTGYTSHTHAYLGTAATSDFLGTTYTSHTHPYLSSDYTSHTHPYLNTSVSSEFQQTSLMSNYLNTGYTTHTHSEYVNTSVTSLFQQTSDNSLSLGTGYTTHTHSQYLNTSVSSEFQQSSLMSNYLDTGYTSHTHSQYLNNSQSSLFQHTSATSAITSNALNTSQSSLFQHTSAMTNYLSSDYTSHTHSQYINTSESSVFQQTSLMSNYLQTDYTSHTHSQYLNTSQSSLFEQTSHTTAFALVSHSHGNPTLALTNISGTTASNSAGLTLSLSAAPGGGGADGYNILAAGSQTANTTGTIVFSNSNGVTFGMSNNSVITASYTVPTDYLSSNQSSIFVQTSQSSLFRHTSADSVLQFTSQMSDYLNTNYTTHTHNEYLNTSQSSLLQHTSATSAITSNALHTSQSSLFRHTSADSQLQFTSQMSEYLGTAYTTHTHSQYINNSQSSLFQHTSATSAITSNVLNTSQSSLFQHTSAMTDYLGSAYTSHTHSEYLNTSQSSVFQMSSLMTNYLETGYTTHTHSQYINTSVSSNFLTSQSVQPVAASGSNGSFQFSTLSFGNLNGMSFYTSNGSIVASYTDGGGAGGGIVLGNSQTTFTNNTVYLEGSNLTVQSTTGQSFIISAPAVSVISGTGQVSVSTNGSTISIGVPNASTDEGFNPYRYTPMVAGQQGNMSLHIQPINLKHYVQFDRFVMPVVFSGATNSTGSYTLSLSVGVYSRNASSLSLIDSCSNSYGISHSGTVSSSSYVGGIRLATIGTTGTFSPGNYWFAVWSRTTSSSANASISQYLMSNINSTFAGFIGQTTATSFQYELGRGHYSATFSTAMPAAIPFSDIRGTASIVLRPPIGYFASSTL